MSPEHLETLARTSLLAGMSTEARDAIIARCTVREFRKNDLLIARGDEAGRFLLLLLEGTAHVRLSETDSGLVAVLEQGDIAGEMAFFDPQAPRAADVVGTSSGAIAVLPLEAYEDLRSQAHPGAAALERAVLWRVGQRMRDTSKAVDDLLDQLSQARLVDVLAMIFGVDES